MVAKPPLVSLWDGQIAVSVYGGKNECQKKNVPKNFQMSEQYWGCLDKMSEVNFSPAETLFNHLVFKFGKCGSWEGIRTCTRHSRIYHGCLIGDGPGKPVKGVWHCQLANHALPYCRYNGIVLLKEKIVSNSLTDLQDMWVKDFIPIALACKWPQTYYAN